MVGCAHNLPTAGSEQQAGVGLGMQLIGMGASPAHTKFRVPSILSRPPSTWEVKAGKSEIKIIFATREFEAIIMSQERTG